MDNHKEEEAIAELSRAIAFKADLHLLHLRAAFHEHKEDVLGALRDCRAALSVDPNHQEMLELHSRVNRHEPWAENMELHFENLAALKKLQSCMPWRMDIGVNHAPLQLPSAQSWKSNL